MKQLGPYTTEEAQAKIDELWPEAELVPWRGEQDTPPLLCAATIWSALRVPPPGHLLYTLAPAIPPKTGVRFVYYIEVDE
jgi:hypothetical protein